jgi:hypothetical protein
MGPGVIMTWVYIPLHQTHDHDLPRDFPHPGRNHAGLARLTAEGGVGPSRAAGFSTSGSAFAEGLGFSTSGLGLSTSGSAFAEGLGLSRRG